jgi:hypothetical protein
LNYDSSRIFEVESILGESSASRQKRGPNDHYGVDMSGGNNPNNMFSSGFGNNFLDMLSMGSSNKNQNLQSAEKVSEGALSEDNFGSGNFNIRSRLDEIRDITEAKSNKLNMSPPKKNGLRLAFDSETENSQALTA